MAAHPDYPQSDPWSEKLSFLLDRQSRIVTDWSLQTETETYFEFKKSFLKRNAENGGHLIDSVYDRAYQLTNKSFGQKPLKG